MQDVPFFPLKKPRAAATFNHLLVWLCRSVKFWVSVWNFKKWKRLEKECLNYSKQDPLNIKECHMYLESALYIHDIPCCLFHPDQNRSYPNLSPCTYEYTQSAFPYSCLLRRGGSTLIGGKPLDLSCPPPGLSTPPPPLASPHFSSPLGICDELKPWLTAC